MLSDEESAERIKSSAVRHCSGEDQKCEQNAKDITLKDENILSTVLSLLALPLQLEESECDTSSFFATCPWCASTTEHQFMAKGFLRKDEYRCSACSQRTSKCIKYVLCGSGARSSLLWDDALCENCDRDVQRLGAGEITLGAFVDKFQLQSGGKPLDCLDTESKLAQACKSSNTDPIPDLPSLDEHSNEVSTIFKVSTPFGEFHSSNSGESKIVLESDMLTLVSGHDDQLGSNNSCNLRSKKESICDIDSNGLSESLHAEVEVEHPVESWMVVRDAVLNWPGPERVDVDRYRELCSHKSWIRRWIVSCGGDEVWAIKRILAHLKWRQSYRLDTITQEDWDAMDARGEMYVSGVDKAGCPSWTWRAHLHDASLSTPEMGTRFLICMMERAWAVNPMAERISVICDCTGLAFNNYEHKMFLLCLDILSEHYPDNLKMTLMFPVSWALSTVVAIGKNFLDPVTRDKMVVLREEELLSGLARHFDEDQLEPRLGGRLCLESATRRRILEEDPAAAAQWQAEERFARVGDVQPVAGAWDLIRRAMPRGLQHLVLVAQAASASAHGALHRACVGPRCAGGDARGDEQGGGGVGAEHYVEALAARPWAGREAAREGAPEAGPRGGLGGGHARHVPAPAPWVSSVRATGRGLLATGAAAVAVALALQLLSRGAASTCPDAVVHAGLG